MVSGGRPLCSLCGETRMKSDFLDMGEDQAPIRGGLSIPSLPPPACYPSFLGALGSPIIPLSSCYRAGVWLGPKGLTGRRGKCQGSLAASDAPSRWTWRGSLGSPCSHCAATNCPIQGGGQCVTLGHSSPTPGLPQHCPCPDPGQMLNQMAWRGRANTHRDQGFKRENRFISCHS